MRYRIEFGKSVTNRLKAQKFRQKIFRNSQGGSDEDRFDHLSDHCLIFDKKRNDKLVLVFRTRMFFAMSDILDSYSSQYYDLTKLMALSLKPMEIGRLCIDKEASDPFLLVTAFKYLKSLITSMQINFLFGFTIFISADDHKHVKALSILLKNQSVDSEFQIRRKSSDVIKIQPRVDTDDKNMAKRNILPPLLNFYLKLGGRVSDHAVIDRDLDTLHVFTYLDLRSKRLN